VSRDSDITNRLQTLCQSAGIALAYGYIERDGQALYNAVSVIDAAGHNVAHYRKTHLWGDLDRTLFTAGDAFSPVFELNGWHIGLLICYDIEFPESVRHLALQGAELILTPTALMTPWTIIADDVTRVRAVENLLYVAYANYCGSEGAIDYVGRSCIAGPDATELARAGATPELLLGRLSKARIEQMREHLPYYRDRRPELYRLQ
jgi:predicted amidohydrolase